MVQLSSLLAGLVVATTALASPLALASPSAEHEGRNHCLSASTASGLVYGFASLISNYSTATAESLLASDFSDTSDSINFLANVPEGVTIFPTKLAFEIGQGAQPPIPFSVINIDAVTCNVVAFRWFVTINSINIKGINIFVAKYSGNKSLGVRGWQIETNYSEFDSGLWFEAIGGKCSR